MNNYPVRVLLVDEDEQEFVLRREVISQIGDHRFRREEQLKLKAQLRQSQKLETLGLLAAGVVHDTNNVLGIILGEVELLKSAVPRGGSAENSLRQISSAAECAARFLRQLLQFSRPKEIELKPLDLNIVLHNLEDLLPRLLDKHISLETRCAAGLPPIKADLGMMEQLVMNLAVNARDAMPTGGTLQIATTAMDLEASRRSHHPAARSGKYVCLVVADTGCGIDRETLTHIFDPFFSTKDTGKGTGLGLATVQGIVKQHGGWIEVESEVGVGSIFRVFLPQTARPTEQLVETELQLKLLHGGRETILLVEDETALRQTVSSVLKQYGYHVLEAACGPDALRMWDAQNGKIDMLLIDLVMPGGLNGHELAMQLKSRRPDLKVIYSSGYSTDMMKDAVGETGALFLPKPYSPKQLVRAVRQCLDTTPGTSALAIPA